MSNNLGQVSEYSHVQKFKSLVETAKRSYLKHLISLGYVLETISSYEDTVYLAIHPDYYLTNKELWKKEYEEDRYVSDGRHSPEDYPEGAFIVINSFCISDNPDYMIRASDFLDEDKCNIDYLGEIK